MVEEVKADVEALRNTLRSKLEDVWAQQDKIRQDLKKAARSAWESADPDYALRVALSKTVKGAVASAYRNCMTIKQDVPTAKCYADAARSAGLAGKLKEYWKKY